LFCTDTAPASPLPIGQELTKLLSDVFEYHGGNAQIDRLIQGGLLRKAREGETLPSERRYLNYGCLYFESVISYADLKKPGLLEKCQKAGIALNVWTVNTNDQARGCAELGINAMITDYPDKARQWLAKTTD